MAGVSHQAFRACMAYHDHLISTPEFVKIIKRFFSWPHWPHITKLVTLCGGA